MLSTVCAHTLHAFNGSLLILGGSGYVYSQGSCKYMRSRSRLRIADDTGTVFRELAPGVLWTTGCLRLRALSRAQLPVVYNVAPVHSVFLGPCTARMLSKQNLVSDLILDTLCSQTTQIIQSR